MNRFTEVDARAGEPDSGTGRARGAAAAGADNAPPTGSGSRRVPFSRPSIGEAEKEAVLRVLDSGWLTTGEEAAAFEREFADAVGARHACAVNSATAGLHLALEAAGVRAGDRVAVPTYTFAATAEVVRYLGADPLFVDSMPNSPNLSIAELQAALAGPATDAPPKAIVPVHLCGLPCDVTPITELAETIGATVVEDAAHAFPAELSDGSPVGSRGTAVFSFYATKPITTGEGGMVVTDDESIAERMRVMRLHGIDRPIWNRYRGIGTPWEYDVVAPGFKYNMPDLLAAVGRAQLGRAETFRRCRADAAHDYRRLLSDLPDVRLPDDDPGHAWHLFCIRVPAGFRDRIIEGLAARGIGASVHYRPLHMMSYYRERYSLNDRDFPHATARFRETISLPLYPELDSADRLYVVESLKQTMTECRRGSR